MSQRTRQSVTVCVTRVSYLLTAEKWRLYWKHGGLLNCYPTSTILWFPECPEHVQNHFQNSSLVHNFMKIRPRPFALIWQTDRQTDGQTDRRTDRQIDWWTDRHTDRQTDKKLDEYITRDKCGRTKKTNQQQIISFTSRSHEFSTRLSMNSRCTNPKTLTPSSIPTFQNIINSSLVHNLPYSLNVTKIHP